MMKLLLVALFAALAVAAPTPNPSNDAVELIVNGVPEGQPLELGNIVELKLKEVVEGEVASATNLLHPFTAQGLAEAAEAVAAAEAEAIAAAQPEPEPVQFLPELVEMEPVVMPEPVVLPEPSLPEIIPAPIQLPEAASPEVAPSPVVLPEPANPEVVAPAPIVLPEPATPEVIAPAPIVLPEPATPEIQPEPVALPEPAAPEVIVPEPVEEQPAAPSLNGEVYNDGIVQVHVNAPEAGVYSTLQSWVNVFLNYVNNGVQYTQQLF